MTLSRPARPAFNTQALNSAVGAILALDVEGRVTLANPRAVEITGYALPDLLGRPLLELLSADEQPRLSALTHPRRQPHHIRFATKSRR